MKHIGKCLDSIQMAFVKMPKELDSPQKKIIALSIIKVSRKYATILENLITNSQFGEIIKRLENVDIDGIKMQAKEVETLLKDLEHSLLLIDLTLNELFEIASKDDLSAEDKHIWRRSYTKIVRMINEKFGGKRGDLRREFQISLHKAEELREAVALEKHLADLLK